MNVEKITKELENLYPGKFIIQNKNDKGIVTEILCEVEPTRNHPEYSFAVCILDSSTLHYHKETTEFYKVIKSKLKVFIDDKIIELKEGETLEIKPGQKHRAEGNETWFEVRSTPGWGFEDHILV